MGEHKFTAAMKTAGSAVSNVFRTIGKTFVKGDWKTKVSYLIMGFGSLLRGAWLRGVALLAVEAAYIAYMVCFGWDYLKELVVRQYVEKEGVYRYFLGSLDIIKADRGGLVTQYPSNSFFILLFSILSLVLTVLFLVVWYLNIVENKNEEDLLARGKRLPTASEDIASLLDKNFDKTLLALPCFGILVFTVVPILFMICIAFTNYDKEHAFPNARFAWDGLKNFASLLQFGSGTGGFGMTFLKVLAWTLAWAFLATFLNYFLGMAVAILINKKGIKFKKMWRTILVVTIAVPQLVSLLYMHKLFANDGLVNYYLMNWHIIDHAIKFWDNPWLSKVLIILINLWIGIPYLMLVATGLLMNIPEDLYEAARIDGANSIQMFFKITLPYMLFVTGPYLLTQFTGNINNFNVIYLLNQGEPYSSSLTNKAGHTDLLVTWLYKMTTDTNNYKMAAVIGIMVFIVVSVISLIVYNFLPSVKDEEGFQ